MSATSVLNGIGNSRSVLITTLISSFSTIVITFLLVPIQGMIAAALGILAGYVIKVFIGIIFLRREGIWFEHESILKPLFSTAISFLIGFLLCNLFGNFLITFTAVAIVYLASSKLIGAISFEEIVYLIKTSLGKT
jgi:O-antigen/teichoic acid export membrane protein